MDDEEPLNPAEDPPAFPYSVLWAGYGNAKVELLELESNEKEYLVLNDSSDLFDQNVPIISIEQVTEVLRNHQIGEELAKSIWLVCAFYLAPKQMKVLGIDPPHARRTLLAASEQAKRLYESLSRLTGKVFVALDFKRRLVPDLINSSGPSFFDLQNELSDFADVAIDAAYELANEGGRPRYHYRDSMFRLLIEILFDHGIDDMKVSAGTKLREEPHLVGKAGRLIFDLVRLVEPNWTEEWVAPKVKPLLRDVSRKRAGAKTQQS